MRSGPADSGYAASTRTGTPFSAALPDTASNWRSSVRSLALAPGWALAIWALGLFGELNRPQLYVVVVLAWALMLAWSKPWLDRYRYGPLEWLWRCLTYRTLFPLKK